MRTRRARLEDAPAIHALIESYAAQGLMLPRPLDEIREHAARFLVLLERGKLLGCVSLEDYGADLAEIRSLAVHPDSRGRGFGARLLEASLNDARRRRIARIFAVTHAPDFFLRQGFHLTRRQAIPEKIARDCNGCPKARRCRLAAVVMEVLPERVILPVMDASATPASAA